MFCLGFLNATQFDLDILEIIYDWHGFLSYLLSTIFIVSFLHIEMLLDMSDERSLMGRKTLYRNSDVVRRPVRCIINMLQWWSIHREHNLIDG